MNGLSQESSPYLLQHADNPVDWMPWGERAFDRASRLDRPLFVSIGYSTCHWCHVMERESFSDGGVAGLMNRDFVCVKVDREERPDVDSLYMRAAISMNGSGGWPLNVVLTPEGKPFFAATYIPRTGGPRRPGMLELLPSIADAWRRRRDEIERTAERLTSIAAVVPESDTDGLAGDDADRAFGQLEQRFDDRHGGFGGAPKFPMPHAALFLVRRSRRTGCGRPAEMALSTLRSIHRGGVYDQLGFGLHRYSTDAAWHLPHFEKMLYDQAMTVTAAVEAWETEGDEEVRRLAERTLDYMLRRLRHPEGGFCSAEDADSPGGEGAFYTWTARELRGALSGGDWELARRVWDVREEGNYRDEATGRPSGRNVLDAGGQPPMSDAEEQRLEEVRLRLLEVRSGRPAPAVDDKVLADWNGLAIAALARAGLSFDDYGLVRVAEEAASFILSAMVDGDGNLLHRWRGGVSGIRALADDYAFLAWGLLELHQATQDHSYLIGAKRLCETLESEFRLKGSGAYSISPRGSGSRLPSRPVETADGALPSANSVSLQNLHRIWRLTGDSAVRRARDRLSEALAAAARRSPAGQVMAMAALEEMLDEPVDVVVCGDPAAAMTASLMEEARRHGGPAALLLLREPDDSLLAGLAPHTEGMGQVDGSPAAYVCRGFACGLPVTEPEDMASALQAGGS
jgi:hypothetical protein